MHELAICQSLLAQVEAVARENEAERVTVVTIEIGPLSGVVPVLLKRTFAVARRGTLAEHAKLVIEETQPRIRCRRCATEASVAQNRLLCPKCGDFHVTLIGGDELTLKTVALHAPEPPGTDPGPVNSLEEEC